jgi:DNA replication and repair protein RecF
VFVHRISLRNFRSYARLELELPRGLVLVTGRNGVGKTNFLEALHVGSQGFSQRTRAEPRLVRFGEASARVALAGAEDGADFETEVRLAAGEPKRISLNGAPLASAEELRTRFAALAFTPDRLAVVKGGPIVRRAYLDRMLGRLFPGRALLPTEYGRTLAQRNAALRRVRAGMSSREALEPWSGRLAELGTQLDRSRAELVDLLAAGFSRQGETLGLAEPALAYDERGLTSEELDGRLERDLARGTTSAGPHLRDLSISADGRDLRGYGSQGEQRAAVLGLVLAEAELLAERRRLPPLLLLDDVFSELDEERRAALVAALPPEGQTLVTATERGAYPASAPEPAAVLGVIPGEVRPA